MPLSLPDTSSLTLFKSSASMTSRINNDLLSILSSTGFDEYDNLKGVKRMDVSTAPPSPVNCSISIERRVNSADILRVRRNSDKSSLLSNKKHPDWVKSILSRLQLVFLKRNDQKSEKIPEDESIINDLSTSSRSSSSVDTVQVVGRDNSFVDHNKDVITPNLDKNNKSDVDSNIGLSQQDICDAIIPKSLDHHYDEDSNLKDSSNNESSSFFDVCAQTPRHFSKEPEVLGKVGRFTIVREREDFNTTMFDQCHCHEKPCRFSANGGVHPVLPPESLPELVPHYPQFYPANAYTPPIRIPVQKNLASYKISSQQYGTQLRHNSWDSIALYRPGVSQSSLYTQQSSAATSRSSLSSLKYSSDSTSVNKITTSNNCDLINTRGLSKNIINKSIKPPSPVVNGLVRPKRSSSSNKVTENLLQEILYDRRQQLLPTATSKLETHEPYTTINSHTGRKFEVEWSSSSSETASSPSSTMSSGISLASSPNSSLYSIQGGASTRSSTLSSKCGRKFVISRNNE
ncbi:30_t:CDS:1 [Cetraspora pellucida]|uniref:30_t:CDS:1 n=1 Tax=Cetraspora pellucida TaxID=1433469 RepID=A0ACA9MBP9_9GLOM|nr:30_t:CDS:1 [Cetraspora pellucida]